MTDRPRHIVLVEDERHLALGISFNLEAEGYQVTAFAEGPAALAFAEAHDWEIDLMILDLMLPGMSGYEVCESIRNSGIDFPVLMLTARNQTGDRVQGFDVGANQYMAKPFDLDELLSRVKNLISHTKRAPRPATASSSPKLFEFQDFRIDFEQCEVTKGTEPLNLTRRELELLRYFVEHEGKLISRQELLEKVWGLPGHIQTRAPDQFMLRLRKIFEPDPTSPRHFLTMRDMGYKFLSLHKT